MKFIKLILCLSIILFAFPAASEIYKYVDENGDIHFTDDFNRVPVEQRPVVDASVDVAQEMFDHRRGNHVADARRIIEGLKRDPDHLAVLEYGPA